jgi:hypothetical protein
MEHARKWKISFKLSYYTAASTCWWSNIAAGGGDGNRDFVLAIVGTSPNSRSTVTSNFDSSIPPDPSSPVKPVRTWKELTVDGWRGTPSLLTREEYIMLVLEHLPMILRKLLARIAKLQTMREIHICVGETAQEEVSKMIRLQRKEGRAWSAYGKGRRKMMHLEFKRNDVFKTKIQQIENTRDQRGAGRNCRRGKYKLQSSANLGLVLQPADGSEREKDEKSVG